MLATFTRAQGAKAFELSDRAIDARTQVVTIHGEVDLYEAPDIRRRIDELIDAGKTLQAIDLTEARFVDSTTVGVLLVRVVPLTVVEPSAWRAGGRIAQLDRHGPVAQRGDLAREAVRAGRRVR